MSLEFSRRSFLKYTAVAAVAVAGAGMFSGCEKTDTKNLSCEGAGSITVLQTTAELGTYNKTSKKYEMTAIKAGDTTASFPFKITVGRANNLPINRNNFKVIVYDKKNVQKARYIGGASSDLTIPETLLDINLPQGKSVSGTIELKNLSLAAGDKIVLTYCPDLQYAEYSMNWNIKVV